jgi:phage terminase large subunit-like protein
MDLKIPLPTTLDDYAHLEREVKKMTYQEVMNLYWVLARADLYFLLRYVLSSKEYFKPGFGIQSYQWILDRCRDVQNNSNKVVDVWARFHWKSNIKSFANIIRHILLDPDTTILILSHTRPNAKKFMSQVYREITTNSLLKKLSWNPLMDAQAFPDDTKDFPRLSLDDGIIVNRSGNPREATIEAAGLVDSLPQGPHFKIRCVDDAVSPASVNTPEMKEKTLSMWELSQPLGMPGGKDLEWITGTFYAYDDAYHSMIERGYDLRLHPCFEIDWSKTEKDDTGKITKLAHYMDKPVLYTGDRLKDLMSQMGASEGSKNAALQMLCDPSAGTATGFELSWLIPYEDAPEDVGIGKNKYILVDPACEKKLRRWTSSYTAMIVLGLGSDGNYYWLDAVRDRMNLSERTHALFHLHRKWKPLEVRYEKYGLQSDIEHIQHVMREQNYRFRIVEVKGIASKMDRINRLEPIFRGGKFYHPTRMWYRTVDGQKIDLVDSFRREEYATFPNSSYMDMLDAMARICEPEMRLVWPKEDDFVEVAYNRGRKKLEPQRRSWMAV